MGASLRVTISRQISDIIIRHLEELTRYVSLGNPRDDHVPADILESVERLAVICTYPPDGVQGELYNEARCCQATIETFLQQMNQQFDTAFKESYIGSVLWSARQWCEAAAMQRPQLTLKQVWALIAPARPDRLKDLGDGLYEARWWRPVPMMDIEILQRTERIAIQGEPFEPERLPGGLAVRFSIAADSEAMD